MPGWCSVTALVGLSLVRVCWFLQGVKPCGQAAQQFHLSWPGEGPDFMLVQVVPLRSGAVRVML